MDQCFNGRRRVEIVLFSLFLEQSHNESADTDCTRGTTRLKMIWFRRFSLQIARGRVLESSPNTLSALKG
jgi:hypothetical protein